jgi:hypothetical protein
LSWHEFILTEIKVENATDYKYSSAMYHAGLVNNSLVTDYDIGVLPSEYQDYLKSMVGVQHEIY